MAIYSLYKFHYSLLWPLRFLSSRQDHRKTQEKQQGMNTKKKTHRIGKMRHRHHMYVVRPAANTAKFQYIFFSDRLSIVGEMGAKNADFYNPKIGWGTFYLTVILRVAGEWWCCALDDDNGVNGQTKWKGLNQRSGTVNRFDSRFFDAIEIHDWIWMNNWAIRNAFLFSIKFSRKKMPAKLSTMVACWENDNYHSLKAKKKLLNARIEISKQWQEVINSVNSPLKPTAHFMTKMILDFFISFFLSTLIRYIWSNLNKVNQESLALGFATQFQ